MHFMFDNRPKISLTLKFLLNIFNLLLKQSNIKPYICYSIDLNDR